MTDAELEHLERTLPTEEDGGCEGHYGPIARDLVIEVRRLRAAERFTEAVLKSSYAAARGERWNDWGVYEPNEEQIDAMADYRYRRETP